jgi:flagellar assembly protein FliH
MSKMWERADFWPADRVASPVADEFTRGVAEGRRTVEAELAAEREALLQLIAGLEALEAPMMAAVERLVTDIAGNAPVDRALLEERAAALSALIVGESELVLAVSPDDVALFGDRAVIGDPALPRGTVQVRVGEAVIEDGVTSALARLRAEIAAMGIAL